MLTAPIFRVVYGREIQIGKPTDLSVEWALLTS
jgi:hypothetical protein